MNQYSCLTFQSAVCNHKNDRIWSNTGGICETVANANLYGQSNFAPDFSFISDMNYTSMVSVHYTNHRSTVPVPSLSTRWSAMLNTGTVVNGDSC